MTTSADTLTLRIHLEDGRTAVFKQTDKAKAAQLLATIQPGKLFAQPVLSIGDHSKLTSFQSRLVTRVDLIGANIPEWPFFRGVQDIREIARDDFERATRSGAGPQIPPRDAIQHRLPVTVHAEMEMVNGERLFLAVRVQIEQRTPLEQGLFMQQMFASSGLYSRRDDGGLTIVNPACVARIALYPGPEVLPPGGWEATHVES